MPDISLEWGGDFSLTPAGDLALVDGTDLTRQRIIRRLYTVARTYLWHSSYGAGLPQRIGRVAREANIRSLVRSQIALESSVARLPLPVVTVARDSATPGLFVISITYTDAVTGDPVAITLQVPGR